MTYSQWSNLSRPTSRMFSFFEINRIHPGPWSCMRASFLSFSLYPVLVLVSNEMKTTFKTLHKYDDVGARCLFICDHCCNEESVRKRIIEESCETRKRLSCILQQSQRRFNRCAVCRRTIVPVGGLALTFIYSRIRRKRGKILSLMVSFLNFAFTAILDLLITTMIVYCLMLRLRFKK
jgi:hypothetical protein